MIQKPKLFLRVSTTCSFFLTADVHSILISPYGQSIPGTTRDLHFIFIPVTGILSMEFVFFCCEIFGHIHRIAKETFFYISQRINGTSNSVGKSLCNAGEAYKNGAFLTGRLIYEGLEHRHDTRDGRI